MVRTILLLMPFLLAPLVSAEDLALEEIRSRLLNKEVVILEKSHHDGSPLSDTMIEWYLVIGKKSTGYKKNSSIANYHAPDTVIGKRGVVLSIEQAESILPPKKVAEKDVFGKTIEGSQVMDPYLNVVVNVLDEDLLIGTTTYYSLLMGNALQLESQANLIKKEIEDIIAQLMGKTLYKAGYTILLDPSISLKDLFDYNKRGLSRDYNTKNLTPLKVVDGKLFEAENAVVIKVELPDSKTRLLFWDISNYKINGDRKNQLPSMNITTMEKIPSKFYPNELAAIKESKIFQGMSEDALFWSWGFPEKTSDWGSGGEQYIYYGDQYVYVGGKKNRDWQHVK
jgi:hypothetical protein